MAGMRDVARKAGVSLSTVSIVLNQGDKFVSEPVRQAVLAAAEELDYHLPAKKNAARTFALVLPDLTNSYYINISKALSQVLYGQEALILYFSSDYSIAREKAYLQTLKRQKIDGIALYTECPREQEEEYFAWIEQEFGSLPVVLMGARCNREHFYSIYIDNFTSAYGAMQHLIDAGHTKIAYIAGNDARWFARERKRAYLQAHRDHNFMLNNDLMEMGDLTAFGGYSAMRRLLEKGEPFTGLFAANDQMAIGAIKAAKAYGRRVPDDIAVVGFDNLNVTSLIDPGLTTVNVPTYQMGRIAAKLLLDAAAGARRSRQHRLDTNLIVRRSSDPDAINEWELTGW